jgi:hypothetical protein
VCYEGASDARIEETTVDTIWLLKGSNEAPGWKTLEADAKAKKMEVLLFDRDAWALVSAAEAPTQYDGLKPFPPLDGLYLDNHGHSVYLVAGQLVKGPREVLASLGDEATRMLEKVGGDPDTALERLGRVY